MTLRNSAGDSGRVLGVDYGTVRVGLAASDESRTFSFEIGILPPDEFLKTLPEIIREREIGLIVVGLPTNMSGADTASTTEARRFAEAIAAAAPDIPIEFVDERLSSQMAGTMTGGGKNAKGIDGLAAQILLETYLTKQKNKNP